MITTNKDAPVEGRVPVLLYHSVSLDPPALIRRYTVTPAVFRSHLELIVDGGFTVLTVPTFADVLLGRSRLPPQPLLVTFDDGFADFYDNALPALRRHGLRATLYLPTAFLRGSERGNRRSALAESMLAWSQLTEIEHAGIELGAHGHTHRHLDTLAAAAARDEITRSKMLLEDAVGHEVATFAYPNGYLSSNVARLVAEAGFRSACAVKNAFSSATDDVFAIARLMVTAKTSLPQLRGWLYGSGAPDAPPREQFETSVWRLYRRARVIARGKSQSSLR
jgi:peptidoglycan/xylan/chitin deacetylase (PgdA/CDA1 family)